jgi:hypothetical protein
MLAFEPQTRYGGMNEPTTPEAEPRSQYHSSGQRSQGNYHHGRGAVEDDAESDKHANHSRVDSVATPPHRQSSVTSEVSNSRQDYAFDSPRTHSSGSSNGYYSYSVQTSRSSQISGRSLTTLEPDPSSPTGPDTVPLSMEPLRSQSTSHYSQSMHAPSPIHPQHTPAWPSENSAAGISYRPVPSGAEHRQSIPNPGHPTNTPHPQAHAQYNSSHPAYYAQAAAYSQSNAFDAAHNPFMGAQNGLGNYYPGGMTDVSAFQRRRRGNLPKEAVNIMKKWYNEHLSSPYPSEEVKLHLCSETGLTMNQVRQTYWA